MDSGQMYRVYRNQAAPLICPLISSFFFLSNFQTLKFFVTLFSGTVRPRRLKHGTHMDNGQMYHVNRNQAAPLIRPFILHPTSKKLREHIGFGLSIRSSKTVHARVLKFHIWIPHEKIVDRRFFLVQVISLSGVMPLWKNLNEIWCMPYLMNHAC